MRSGGQDRERKRWLKPSIGKRISLVFIVFLGLGLGHHNIQHLRSEDIHHLQESDVALNQFLLVLWQLERSAAEYGTRDKLVIQGDAALAKLGTTVKQLPDLEQQPILKRLQQEWRHYRRQQSTTPPPSIATLERLANQLNKTLFSATIREQKQRERLMDLLEVVGIALMILLYLDLQKRVVGPLRRLTNGARRFAAGEREISIKIESRDEVGELVTAFNDTAREVGNLIAHIKRDREEISAHELKWRSILNAAADGILIVDANGRINSANPQCTQIFGYEHKQLIGQPVELLVPEALREHHSELMRHYREQPHIRQVRGSQEIRGLRRNGQEIPLEISLSPLTIGAENLTIAVIRDITARRQAEASQSRLTAIIDNTPDLVGTCRPDGTIMSLNPAGRAMLELPGDTPLEQICIDHFHTAESAKRVRDIGFPAAIMHGYWQGETCMRSASGRTFDTSQVILAHRGMDGEIEYFSTIARDVTDERRTEELLKLRDRAIESSSNGILICDVTRAGHPIIYVNPALERITGVSAEELFGIGISELFKEEATLSGDEITTVLNDQQELHKVLHSQRPDNSQYWGELHLSPVRNDGGDVSHYIGVITDITARKEYEAQLEFRATHDELTGLANRIVFQDRLTQALHQARRTTMKVTVAHLDLDNFKHVNDALGHQTGDRLLHQVGQRLTHVLREVDTVARLGGDDYTLVLPNLSSNEDMVSIAGQLFEALSAPFTIGEHELIVTASMGLSLYPDDGGDDETLLRKAESAMYRAKRAGKNSYRFFTSDMDSRAMERLALEHDLHRALANGEMQLQYQPRVSMDGGRITGLEALIRWQHPRHGTLMPEHFIPLAIENGLIVNLGQWVLQQACTQLGEWRQAGFSDISISVNIAAAQLHHAGFVDAVRQALEQAAIPPSRLELELTESALSQRAEDLAEVMHELKGLGVKLVIDDFGAGHSDLSYLKLFPIDKVKIDMLFIRDITRDPGDAAIVVGIIAMAHALHIGVVAEGIETESQKVFLGGKQCDEFQGFYFSKPLDAAQSLQRLQEMSGFSAKPPSEMTQDKTLLLVDDEPNITRSLNRVLRRDGYRILTANSPDEAFELLAKNRVDVILSDQRMPQMNGTEFLSRVKSLYPDTVRMILSGYTDLETITDAINRGAIYKFLTKPWEDELLRSTIHEAFELRRSPPDTTLDKLLAENGMSQ